jgi:hypothetical protein
MDSAPDPRSEIAGYPKPKTQVLPSLPHSLTPFVSTLPFHSHFHLPLNQGGYSQYFFAAC